MEEIFQRNYMSEKLPQLKIQSTLFGSQQVFIEYLLK